MTGPTPEGRVPGLGPTYPVVMARSLHDDGAVRITTAATSRSADIATRQKRYLWSMSLRSACFVGAGIAALAGVGWLWPILIVGAIVLPYIAVVLANAATTRTLSLIHI